MQKEKEMNSKKDLDRLVEIGYNESIKNGIGDQSNLIHLEKKKEMEFKKVLDMRLRTMYNEFIKSEEWFLAHHP